MISIRRNETTDALVSTFSFSDPLARARSTSSALSIIGSDLSIIGNIVSEGEIQIDGIVQGDIQGIKIIVGVTAKITGTISGRDVIINGEVMGSVNADRIVLSASCKLEGDVVHKSLSIEQGAYFEGKSRRGSPPENASTTRQM